MLSSEAQGDKDKGSFSDGAGERETLQASNKTFPTETADEQQQQQQQETNNDRPAPILLHQHEPSESREFYVNQPFFHPVIQDGGEFSSGLHITGHSTNMDGTSSASLEGLQFSEWNGMGNYSSFLFGGGPTCGVGPASGFPVAMAPTPEAGLTSMRPITPGVSCSAALSLDPATGVYGSPDVPVVTDNAVYATAAAAGLRMWGEIPGDSMGTSSVAVGPYDVVELRVTSLHAIEGNHEALRIVAVAAGESLHNIYRVIMTSLGQREERARLVFHAWVLPDGRVYGNGSRNKDSSKTIKTDRDVYLNELPISIGYAVELVFGKCVYHVAVQDLFVGLTDEQDLIWTPRVCEGSYGEAVPFDLCYSPHLFHGASMSEESVEEKENGRESLKSARGGRSTSVKPKTVKVEEDAYMNKRHPGANMPSESPIGVSVKQEVHDDSELGLQKQLGGASRRAKEERSSKEEDVSSTLRTDVYMDLRPKRKANEYLSADGLDEINRNLSRMRFIRQYSQIKPLLRKNRPEDYIPDDTRRRQCFRMPVRAFFFYLWSHQALEQSTIFAQPSQPLHAVPIPGYLKGVNLLQSGGNLQSTSTGPSVVRERGNSGLVNDYALLPTHTPDATGTGVPVLNASEGLIVGEIEKQKEAVCVPEESLVASEELKTSAPTHTEEVLSMCSAEEVVHPTFLRLEKKCQSVEESHSANSEFNGLASQMPVELNLNYVETYPGRDKDGVSSDMEIIRHAGAKDNRTNQDGSSGPDSDVFHPREARIALDHRYSAQYHPSTSLPIQAVFTHPMAYNGRFLGGSCGYYMGYPAQCTTEHLSGAFQVQPIPPSFSFGGSGAGQRRYYPRCRVSRRPKETPTYAEPVQDDSSSRKNEEASENEEYIVKCEEDGSMKGECGGDNNGSSSGTSVLESVQMSPIFNKKKGHRMKVGKNGARALRNKQKYVSHKTWECSEEDSKTPTLSSGSEGEDGNRGDILVTPNKGRRVHAYEGDVVETNDCAFTVFDHCNSTYPKALETPPDSNNVPLIAKRSSSVSTYSSLGLLQNNTTATTKEDFNTHTVDVHHKRRDEEEMTPANDSDGLQKEDVVLNHTCSSRYSYRLVSTTSTPFGCGPCDEEEVSRASSTHRSLCMSEGRHDQHGDVNDDHDVGENLCNDLDDSRYGGFSAFPFLASPHQDSSSPLGPSPLRRVSLE